MPYYTIHHLTRFEYASPVRESVMEARMRPRDGESQTVIDFDLSVSPRVRTSDYRDAFGNHVHHFDVPQTHMYETLTANATVRVDAPAPPPQRLDADAWDRLASEADDLAVWQMTLPSAFCHRSDKLEAFAQQIDARRRDCPLQTAMHLNQQLSEHLRYEPQSTTADSPIDEALDAQSGVCQDFVHIMVTLCRQLGIPARYVSGYYFTGSDHSSQSQSQSQSQGGGTQQQSQRPVTAPDGVYVGDATHAWIEVLMPELGWVGLDPTHQSVCGDRHIRTAIGRDYADVPPTRGVYRGESESKMVVSVDVRQRETQPSLMRQSFERSGWVPPEPPQEVPDEPRPFAYYAQQMQQQQ